ncbi:MAG TPA: SGNH/GDSL hydrolase family protein [Labilithrix sp.]
MRFAWIFRVGLIGAFAAFGSSCGGRASAPTIARPRLVGRFDAEGRFAWSASTIEARFEGRAIAVRLRGGADAIPYTVIVDGGAPRTIEVTRDRERYDLASDLARGEHVVTLVREGEAHGGTHQLLGFEIDGRLLPAPPPRARRIEILGDSITCGYGVLGASKSCHFSFDTERATHAYGWLASRALGADVTTVCWSGRGVIRNYDGSTEGVAPELYELDVPETRSVHDFARDAEPDAVVVALGTNDFIGGNGAPLDVPRFEAAYGRLLARIREARPHALVVIATSPMLGADPTPSGAGTVREVFRASLDRVVLARREVDPRVDLIDLEYQGDRLGCDWHPNDAMHRRLGEQLAAFLAARIGR